MVDAVVLSTTSAAAVVVSHSVLDTNFLKHLLSVPRRFVQKALFFCFNIML